MLLRMDPLIQQYRERAEHRRRMAERTSDADLAEQLRKHAAYLESEAAKLDERASPTPDQTRPD